MNAVRKARCCATGLLCSVMGLAPLGAANSHAVASFQVAVKIASTSKGVCVSEPLSQQTHALFQVTCASGHFVSMSPHPARPFLGTHSGAFQFHLTRAASAARRSSPDAGSAQAARVAEVTAMRVSTRGAALDEQVEILVSF